MNIVLEISDIVTVVMEHAIEMNNVLSSPVTQTVTYFHVESNLSDDKNTVVNDSLPSSSDILTELGRTA